MKVLTTLRPGYIQLSEGFNGSGFKAVVQVEVDGFEPKRIFADRVFPTAEEALEEAKWKCWEMAGEKAALLTCSSDLKL